MRCAWGIRVKIRRGIGAGGGTEGIAGCAAGGQVQGWPIGSIRECAAALAFGGAL